jgi:hypothetical protein
MVGLPQNQPPISRTIVIEFIVFVGAHAMIFMHNSIIAITVYT